MEMPGDNDERVKERELETHIIDLYKTYGKFYKEIKKDTLQMKQDKEYQAQIPKNEDRRGTGRKRPAALISEEPSDDVEEEEVESAENNNNPFTVDDLLVADESAE